MNPDPREKTDLGPYCLQYRQTRGAGGTTFMIGRLRVRFCFLNLPRMEH